MIWIFWLLFIIAECLMHWYFIEVRHEDPTPDGKFTFRHVLVIGARFIVFVALSALLKHPDQIAYICFCIGAFTTHLLIFAPLLNAMRGERLDYLGKGFTDKILAISPFIFRVWALFIISLGMLYAYYNTDLL